MATTTSFVIASSFLGTSSRQLIRNKAQVFFYLLFWLSSFSFVFVSQIPTCTVICRAQAFNIDTFRQYLQLPSRFMNNQRNKNTNKIIRTQTGPDPCLRGISSIQDIQDKVQKIQALQSAYGDAKLYNRQWLPILSQNLSDGHTNGLLLDDCNSRRDAWNFSVLQFNSLAQGLSSSDKVPTPFTKSAKECEEASSKFIYGGFTSLPHPEITLDFNMRKWRVVEVLLEKMTDVIAMEEVDHFHGFFQPLLDKIGYDGLFVPKPCSPCVPFGWYSDGCALFWKREVLELVRQESCSYKSGNQVYTIATMKHLETGCIMVLAVTHLKAGKGLEMEKIRMGQVKELRNHIDRIVELASKESGVKTRNIPVVIMGDFNSDPTEEQSCIWGIGSCTTQKNVNGGDSDSYFASAYPIDPKEMSYFTTWKIRGDKIQKRVIDYIFYKDVKGIECSHILSIPNQEELEESRLPGLKYPSDHLAIGARFQLTKKCGE
jgi:nocturnin